MYRYLESGCHFYALTSNYLDEYSNNYYTENQIFDKLSIVKINTSFEYWKTNFSNIIECTNLKILSIHLQTINLYNLEYSDYSSLFSSEVALLQSLTIICLMDKHYRCVYNPVVRDLSNKSLSLIHQDCMTVFGFKNNVDIPENIKYINIFGPLVECSTPDNVEHIHFSLSYHNLNDFSQTNLNVNLQSVYISVYRLFSKMELSEKLIPIIKSKCKLPFNCKLYINLINNSFEI